LQFAIAAPGKELSSSQMKSLKARMKDSRKNGEPFVDLSGIGIEKTPNYLIEKMGNLEKIDFSFNNLHEWPELEPFRNLQVLDLSGNKLRSIAPTIGMLTTLKELNLNGNNLSVLPPEIGDLSRLEKLGKQSHILFLKH
jgi:Leucine-rich repeat (LRR) protein